MSKEYFDILDENGNKTGKTKLRSEVHPYEEPAIDIISLLDEKDFN